MIVVDASAAVLALLNAGDSRRRLQGEDLHAPALVDSEVVHVIHGKTLSGVLKQKDAKRAIDAWRHLGVRRHLAHGYLERIWALRGNLTAYDATYVALAEALGCELLTADGGLALAPKLRCPITRVTS